MQLDEFVVKRKKPSNYMNESNSPRRSPTMVGDYLIRRTTGLTVGHVELIKVLAREAIEAYLAEIESGEV